MRPPDEVEHQRDDCGRVRFQKEVSAVEHMRFDLTLEFTREQYMAARIPSERWEAGLARDAIADCLARRQPPALMVWGRHDAFFDLAETPSWMCALPRHDDVTASRKQV